MATINASLIPSIDPNPPYTETWAVLIRQEQPIEPQNSSGLVQVNGGAINSSKLVSRFNLLNNSRRCTVKIGLDGTIIYCDDFIVKLLDLELGAQKRIIGKKFWEVFSEKLGSSSAENDLKCKIIYKFFYKEFSSIDHGRMHARARSQNRPQKRSGAHVSSTHHESFFKENRIHHRQSQTSSSTLTPLYGTIFMFYLILLRLFLLVCSNTKNLFSSFFL